MREGKNWKYSQTRTFVRPRPMLSRANRCLDGRVMGIMSERFENYRPARSVFACLRAFNRSSRASGCFSVSNDS